jgi:endonuclease G
MTEAAAAITAPARLAFPGLPATPAARLLAAAARWRPPGSGVVGGHDAEPGKWPEIAAIYVGNIPYCTGVLVAPTVVLTAAHCNTTGLAEVLIGADTLAAGNGGERLPVVQRIEYPDWDLSFDLLVLVLGRPSTRAPRALATGWAGVDVVDDHEVTVVGFGAVDNEGKKFVDPLQEATTTITDALCARKSGCNLAARPAGELGAGGMGIDSCSGDSGGPLYVTGPLGTFVAGLTSRSYDDATLPCSEGGIYTRADRVADWIEEVAGVRIARGRDPSFEPIEITVGAGAQTRITANDPSSTRHRFAIAAGPARGTAAVDDKGTVHMCATGRGEGTDRIVVEITDATNSARRIYTTVPVTIHDGVDDGGCELPEEGGCGCQGGPGGGAGAAAIFALAFLGRALGRRRRGAAPPAVSAGYRASPAALARAPEDLRAAPEKPQSPPRGCASNLSS